MWYVLVFGLIGLIVFIVVGESGRQKRREQEETAIAELEKNGFVKTKESNGLVIDQPNKRWCVVSGDSDETPYVHNFSDIVDVKVVEDGVEYKSNGGLLRAVVGGAAFGALGAAVGASTGKNKKSIQGIYVLVTTKDFNCPTEKIHITGPVSDTTSSYYRLCVEATEEVVGLLAAIQANA